MQALVRSRKVFMSVSGFGPALALASLAGVLMTGCDSHRPPADSIDSGDLSVVMPLSAASLDDSEVSLVAQAPSSARERIPTPPGEVEVRSELVPTPPGERERTSGERENTPAVAASTTASTQITASENEAIAPPAGSISSPAGAEPEKWETWAKPQTVLFVTGNQHGYIEPCGCTGLENQKGGLARRFTLMEQLSERGWPLVPIDAGNQVRRTGRQAEVKFQTAAAGLEEMNYAAVGFGPDDLRLGVGELIAVAAVDDPAAGRFVSANVVLIDPSLMAQAKVVESGGRRIGITSILDPDALVDEPSDEVQVGKIDEKLPEALRLLTAENSDFNVLLFFGDEEVAAKAVRTTPGFDLVVVAGGFGEPTYQAEKIEGSKTKMIVTGNKGMYTGLVGLYPDETFRYARVALTHEFDDAPEMRRLMATYQKQLESLGLKGLGLKPVAHPSGEKFVGSSACGECHTTAFAIWENSAHALATEHIVHPGERGDVSRHFDPECISCHVTGWNAQNYYPYETGYLSLEASSHLHGNGCENCHGPGASHVAAESAGSGVTEAARDALREAMRLPLDKARDRCMECHDLDNSPDFHKEDAFDSYWAEIEHYGKD